MYSCLKMLTLERECTNMEEGLSLGGKSCRVSNVSLSPTLSMNNKVEQHTKKKYSQT